MAAENNNQETRELNEQIKVRRDKLVELQGKGEDPFAITKYDVNAHSKEIKDDYDKWEGVEVTVAGRMMFKRVMGKASFCNLTDKTGNIQIYVGRDGIGEEPYKAFKKMDIGDIIGVKGEVFRTKTQEISIKANEVVLLSKSLQVLPEKFHGLKDTDIRYRQRYLDLIVNPEVKETFAKRSLIIKEIRKYLDERDYIEVETPVLLPMASGAAARPFTTYYNSLDQDMHLRISLELYLKRLIVGGLDRVYEMGRVFRNEGLSTRHSPEYTLLELYQAYTDYYGMLELTEGLIRTVAINVLGTGKAIFDGVELDFEKPFERVTMLEAVKKHSGVDFNDVHTLDEARRVAKEHGVAFEERHKKGEILNLFFEEFVEEHLVQPTFVLDYPVEISPLAKRKRDDEDYTERFELFISKREIANAFSELNDPIDQKKRFMEQEEQFRAGDEEAHHMDEDFIHALEIGMPPTGGLGIGIDRLVMLMTNSYAIRDVLLFPTLKMK